MTKNLKSEGLLILLNQNLLLNVKKLVAYLRHAGFRPIQLLQTFRSYGTQNFELLTSNISLQKSHIVHPTSNFQLHYLKSFDKSPQNSFVKKH